MQLFIHRQWWSNLSTHLPQILQCRDSIFTQLLQLSQNRQSLAILLTSFLFPFRYSSRTESTGSVQEVRNVAISMTAVVIAWSRARTSWALGGSLGTASPKKVARRVSTIRQQHSWWQATLREQVVTESYRCDSIFIIIKGLGRNTGEEESPDSIIIMERRKPPTLSLQLNFQSSYRVEPAAIPFKQSLSFRDSPSSFTSKLVLDRIFTPTDHSLSCLLPKTTQQSLVIISDGPNWEESLWGSTREHRREQEGILPFLASKSKQKQIKVYLKRLGEGQAHPITSLEDIASLQTLFKKQNQSQSFEIVIKGSPCSDSDSQKEISILYLHPALGRCTSHSIKRLCLPGSSLSFEEESPCCAVCVRLRTLACGEGREWGLLFVVSREEHLAEHPVCSLLKECCWGLSKDTIKQSLRKQTEQMESALKRLRERHRSILSILSKCVNLDMSQIDHRSQLYLECVQINERKTDKAAIATSKKAENQAFIEELQTELERERNTMHSLKEQHCERMEQMGRHKEEVGIYLVHLLKQIKELTNPDARAGDNAHSSLYFQPSLKAKKKLIQDQTKENQDTPFSPKFAQSRKSLSRPRPAQPQSQARSNTNVSEGKPPLKISSIKQRQIIAQIQQLVAVIEGQENVLDFAFKEKGHLLGGATLAAFKKRGEGAKVSWRQLQKVLGCQLGERNYEGWVRDEVSHEEWLRDLQERSQLNQTVTTIKEGL